MNNSKISTLGAAIIAAAISTPVLADTKENCLNYGQNATLTQIENRFGDMEVNACGYTAVFSRKTPAGAELSFLADNYGNLEAVSVHYDGSNLPCTVTKGIGGLNPFRFDETYLGSNGSVSSALTPVSCVRAKGLAESIVKNLKN